MKNTAVVLKKMLAKPISNKILSEYEPSGILRTFSRANVDFDKTQQLFKTAQTELSNAIFNLNTCTAKLALVAATSMSNAVLDLNSTTQKLMKVVEESEIRLYSKSFVEEVKR